MDDLLVRGIISVAVASLVGGLISGVITYTSTHFLAAGSMHIILASLIIGYTLSLLTGGLEPIIPALIIITLFSIAIALTVDRGIPQSTAVGSAVFISVSMIALSSYILISIDPFGLSVIYSSLIRSPFLIPLEELTYLTLIGVLLTLAILYIWKYSIYMSLDSEYFRFVRGPLTPYRIAIYVLVAISAMFISFILGVVPAHVVILAPALIYSRISSVLPLQPVIYICSTSIISLFISYIYSIPYGGVLGVLSLVSYIIYRFIR